MKELRDDQKALDYYRAGLCGVIPTWVPKRIVVLITVRSEVPHILGSIGTPTRVLPGEYECESNGWGAISVIAEDGKKLGIKPAEFSVLEWIENPHIAKGR